MLLIVINPLLCNGHLGRHSERCARTEVSVVFQKRVGTDLQANTMPGFEDLTGVLATELITIASPAILRLQIGGLLKIFAHEVAPHLI